MTEFHHIFIDTNTALHFKRPDDVDWAKIVGAKSILLVACPTLLRELEEQKVRNPSKKLRDRAKAYISWLYKYVEDTEQEVRAGVGLKFLGNEPKIDFQKEQLSEEIQDDRLIASVIAYQMDHPKNVSVATADIGLTVKLRTRGISVIRLPTDLELPEEADSVEQENKSLKSQLAELELRQPKLEIRFKDGSKVFEANTDPLTNISFKSFSEIESELQPIPYPKKYSSEEYSALGPFDKIQIRMLRQQYSITSIDRYNSELARFRDSYLEFEAEMEAWRENQRLYQLVELEIENFGSLKATDVDISLEFPDGIQVFELKQLPSRPTPPKPPRRPGDVLEILGSGSDAHDLIGLSTRSQLGVVQNWDGIPFASDDRRSMRITYDQVKHGFIRQFETFVFKFQDLSSTAGFSFEWSISADELPRAVSGKLNVRLPS